MAHDTQVAAWQHRLKEIRQRLQRRDKLSLSELEDLKTQHREIERLIRSFQR